MQRTFLPTIVLLSLLSLTACTSHYQLSQVSRSRIVVDSRYDRQPDAAAAAFLAPYKQKVDSTMSPIVGRAAHNMAAGRPESDLSNLLSDILIWAGKDYGEKPVLAVYNMGGIRATITKGDVTIGDVLDMAPFENKICFLTLTGEKLTELFRQIASRLGEGVSHGVVLTVSPDGQLLDARLNGQAIAPKASYRIATIDYLAYGNDGMVAFKDGTDRVMPSDEKNNVRYVIMNYFSNEMAQGREVSAKIEGRIVVKK
jgi:2',3'-cyclic-nucleotide 2'-phosphodiesterase (5'-nucleotidase family)